MLKEDQITSAVMAAIEAADEHSTMDGGSLPDEEIAAAVAVGAQA